MTMISRRTLTGLTIGAIAVTAAGCGRGSDEPGSSSAPSTLAEGKATGDLTVWAMGAEGEALSQLVKKFETDNPEVKLSVTPVPWDSAHSKFTSAIAAGTTPDVAQIGTTWMGEFVGLKALDQTPANFDTSVFFEGAHKTTEVKGASYAVPWYVETRVIYYRKDLAEKAGVTEAPADWDALKALAKAYKDKAGAKWGISLQPGGTGSWQGVLPFMWSNGGQIANEDATEFTFEDPKNVEALAYFKSFFDEGLANKAPAEGTTEQDFVSGAVPMFISGPWMMASVEKLGGAGFKDKYDVVVMPKKETSASFIGGANLGVFTASKNRDAAWKLVQYLTDPAVQVEWFKIVAALPAVKSSWDDASVSGDEKLAVFGKQLETAFAPPSIPTWEQIAGKFDAQVEQVCKQGLDPAQALRATQTEAQSIGTGS